MNQSLTNIFDLKLSPRMMVEASAGTGKTYTLVGLFVRLIIEKRLPVERILVMTFTRMATRELKGRILERLQESLEVVQGGEPGDDNFLQHLKEWSRRFPDAGEVLQRAIHNVDDAQVYTIHGFCQKVLSEEALLAGTPFDIELLQTDDALREAASDFWRTLVYEHSRSEEGRYYINKVMEFAKTPEELLEVLKPMLRKPYAGIEAPERIDVIGYLSSVLRARFELKEKWFQDKEKILEILRNCDIKRYEGYLEGRVSKLESFFEDDLFLADAPESLKYFTSGYLFDPGNLKKNGKPVVFHTFFELCEQYRSLLERMNNVMPAFMQDAAGSIRSSRSERIRNSGGCTYDDLLYLLRDALQEPGSGTLLAGRLRARTPFALVDEFQDTDPVQYEIFDRIFSGRETDSCLMMIGDPKQAIYAFRGADVYTYLKAKRGVGEAGRYTLNRNFRSSEGLVEGVNALFSLHEHPFIEKEIGFQSSEAGKKEDGAKVKGGVEEKRAAPIRITFRGGIHNNISAREFVFGETARQVARLIVRSQQGKAIVDGKGLTGGDIAILVSSHRDAEELKKRLHRLGVDAVTYSRKKIFESDEAFRLEMLMTAILEPMNPKAASNAVVSGFFGRDVNNLVRLQENEHHRREWIWMLLDLQEVWAQRGFYPAFRKLMMEFGGLHSFTVFENSERIIANLQQLAELCAFAERDHHLDALSLLHWFRRRVGSAAGDGDNEEEMLRLESDRDLVKISTVHNSKGLEFPVVFCPTLWYSKAINRTGERILEYHNSENGGICTLNLDPPASGSEQREKAMHQSLIERVAEEVRKTYVALTRAKMECRVIWTATKWSIYSGLGSLLVGEEKVIDSISNKYTLDKNPDIDENTFRKKLEFLANNYPGAFIFSVANGAEMTDTESTSPVKPEGEEWRVKEWRGPLLLQSKKQLHSFSSLVHHNAPPTDPDYDEWLEEYVDSLERVREEDATAEFDIFSFPKGAAAGTVIHRLFEDERFDFRKGEAPGNRAFISEILNEYGVDEKWVPVVHTMMGNVCGAVTGDLRLSAITPEDQLREMEFTFPTGEPQLDAILNIIRDEGEKADVVSNTKGYMTGFIDLIVRQNGKYYILDYKSNHLGDSFAGYNREALEEAIHLAGYDVQYHLYTVALVKMLRSRIRDFVYDTHFGGVAYLFVRGMRKGSDSGVWFHKPEEYRIMNLERILSRK